MPFEPDRLVQVAYDDGKTLWEYEAPEGDTMADLFSGHYFIPAFAAFDLDDVIALGAAGEVKFAPVSGAACLFLQQVH